MQPVREIAKSILREMEGVAGECNPSAARHYRRLSVIDYANALKNSPYRSPEENKRWLAQAHTYAAKAIFHGASEEQIDASFASLRDYWLPRLEAKNAH